jgi:putative ABC transport system substrate-binding protein
MIKRREFITFLGGAAAWPLAARAQQPMPVIGYLNSGSPETFAGTLTAFRKGLSETGYVEGRNVAIEFRWAEDHYDRLPGLAADLVRRQVAVIYASPTLTALAAKAATATIPILFATGDDPVAVGLVTSLNRPGGNVTGLTGMSLELIGKQLGILHGAVPEATRIATLVNPSNPATESIVADVKAAAAVIGVQIEVLTATTNREIDAAFASLVQKRAAALLVQSDSLFISRRVQLVTLAVKHSVPVIFSFRQDAEAGGLMSYGPSITDVNRQVGIYAGRILKGEKPADMPVMQPAKFEFIINLQTARTLGLDVPPGLLATADEVIESGAAISSPFSAARQLGRFRPGRSSPDRCGGSACS